MYGNCLKLSLVSVFVLSGFLLIAQPAGLINKEEPAYDHALELFKQGQYGNARQLFDKIAEDEQAYSREKRAISAYYSAVASMRLYNKDAEGRVLEFAEKYPLSPLKNRLFLEYANYRFSLKRYRDASEFYQKVEKFNLKGEELNEYLFKSGYAFMMNEEYKPAENLFFELKGRNSEYAASARYYYAHLLYTDSNYTEALSNFLPLQNDESFGPLVPYYLAQIYYRLEDYDKLLDIGEELIEKATSSRSAEIAKLVADAFYHKGDYRNTVKYLELYREKGGKMRFEENFQMGYAYYSMGNYRQAIENLNKITAGRKDLLQNAYYHLADAYLKVGEKKQAISAFSAAADINASPTIREDAYFNYAKLVYEQSDPYRDAISVLNSFLDEFPASPHKSEINRYLANLYITTKDYDKAMLAIERSGIKTLEMQEVYQKVAFYRATEIFNSLKYEAAIKKYRESLQYPVNKTIAALSQYWIGEALYRQENYKDALTAYETFRNSTGAINLSEYNRSVYNTAYSYYKLFDFQPAAIHFRNFSRDASINDPRLTDAYLRLGDSYLMTGGYLVAADFYKAALKANTKEADYALFQMSECLGLAGKKEQKLMELQTLINKFPKSIYAEEAHYEIALTNLQLEKYDKALQSFRDYISQYQQSDKLPAAHLQIGLIYSNTDKNNQALNAYKKVVEDYPGTRESLEAVSLAKLIYSRQNRISDYLDWVEGLNFVSFNQSTQDSIAFNAAFELYMTDSCEQAMMAFSNYLNRFSKGIFTLRSHYYLAGCAERVNRLSVARQSYEAIAEMPRNEYSTEAVEKLALYTYQGKEYDHANKYYKQLADLTQSNSQRIKANAGIMRTAFLLDNFSEAAVYADLVLNLETNDAGLVQEARQIAARSYYNTGNPEESLERFNSIISSSEGEAKAEAMYMKSKILHEQKDYSLSSETIYKLIEDLPSFKEYKMKALLLLAANFWKQEDFFQANHTLDFIIKSDYSPEMVQEANFLKEEIARSEAEAARKKEMEQKSLNQPVLLDNDKGLRIIDDGIGEEELKDTSNIK